VRQIFRTREEPYVGPSLLGDVIADRPLQHWIFGFKSVEDRALRGLALDLEFDIAVDARECPQMCR
jgi:hypothetical protein